MQRGGTNGYGTVATWLLVLGLPLAVSPTATDAYLPLRLVVLGVGLALGLLAPPSGRLPRPVLVALGAALAAFAIAALAGATPALSLLGRYPRYEGLPMVAAYAAALVLGARLFGSPVAQKGSGPARTGRAGSELDERGHARAALALAGLANGLVAVVQAVAEPGARVTGTLGNSSALGTFSLVVLGVLGLHALGSKASALELAGIGGGLLGLVLAASRGAFVGAAVVGVALLVVRGASVRPGWWWAGPALVAVVGLAAWLVPGPRARLAGTTPFAESTISGRLLLWQETTDLVAAHPALGVGPSRFVDAIGGFHTPAWAATVGPYAPPDSPHNVVLQVLAGTGVVGFAAVLAVLGTLALALWRARPWDAWQAGTLLAALGVGTSYLASFTDPVSLVVLALFAGGAVASAPAAASGVRTWGSRVGAAVALVLGLWLGGSALIAEGRYAAAIEAADATEPLRAVPAVRPWDADLARRVGYSGVRLAEAGRADAGAFVPLLSGTCDRLPGSVECLLALADAQDLSGDHQAALDTLARAGGVDPTNVDTVLRQGIALAELERYAEAEERFRHAMELRPTAPEPWTDLAELLRRQGREDEAAAAEAKAEELRR